MVLILLSERCHLAGIIELAERKLKDTRTNDPFIAKDYAVEEWFNCDDSHPPSWKALVEALKECNEITLAVRIEQQDCTLLKESSMSLLRKDSYNSSSKGNGR